MVKTLACDSRGREFDSTLSKLFTHMNLKSPSSIIWYQPRDSDVLQLGR